MELDSNLLKEFAKMTNDSEVKTETKYLRGTIVSNSGGKFVQLDGSTTATPISEIVDVQEGDRVLVTIENHKATIVGNFTFPPSARKEQEAIDKADAAQGTADGANTAANAAQQKAQEAADKADEAINKSSLATVAADEAKEQATEAINKANSAQENVQEAKDLATQASADATEAKQQAAQSQASSANAQAEVTRLQNEVNSAQQDINNALTDLEEQAGEIAGIKNTYATKVEVGNTKAELETTITTKVGELETEVSKTYSTKTENVELEGRLQTQITQNAEGFASQATKIEKLESDTAEARKDVDQALAQAAAAQSTASEAQTKAQAAQDAANAATADANTAAEKAQLAQNAADAATAAANAADQAVQQAQGDLDEAKQNLATVTSRVDATEADIANAQAKVDAAQEAVDGALADAAEARHIADQATEAATQAQQDAETAKGVANTAQQKADNAKTAADNAQAAADKAQQDVAALTQRVTTAETKIEQNSEQVLINANKTEEIGQKIDNLEIGGRNLALKTKTFETFDDENIYRYFRPHSTSLKEIRDNGFTQVIGNGGDWQGIATNAKPYNLKPNDNITVSVNVESVNRYAKISIYLMEYDANDTRVFNNILINGVSCTNRVLVELEENTSKRVSATLVWDNTLDELISSGGKVYITIQQHDTTPSEGSYISYYAPKIEYGNKATDWTPAPEDIENELSTNYYSKTETDAKLKVESDRITSTVTRVETVEKTASDAQAAADAAQEDIDNLEIGGRNYIRETRYFNIDDTRETGWYNKGFTVTTEDDFAIASAAASDLTENNILVIASSMIDFNLIKDKTICVSFDMKVDDIDAWDKQVPFIWEYYDLNNARIGWRDMGIELSYYNVHTLESGVWTKLICVIPPDITIGYSADKSIDDVVKAGLRLSLFRNGSVSYKKVKLEIGTTDTDWTPAPEDAETKINDAQSKANNAEIIANNAQTTVTEMQSSITQLSNMIANLITDENGGSLMTQTDDGWTFNMSSINENLSSIQDEIANMDSEHDATNSAIERLTNLINEVANKTAYITIATDDSGNPCIELGKTDNDFKVRITNTAIDFLEGSTKIAYANNNTFYAEKMIVKNELQIGAGPGFVWRTRSNGNMGLVYISG